MVSDDFLDDCPYDSGDIDDIPEDLSRDLGVEDEFSDDFLDEFFSSVTGGRLS